MTGAALLFAPAFLAGCEMYAPSTLSTEKIQVREQPYFLDVAAGEADDRFAAGVAHHYSRHAGGPLKLTVTYDPGNYRNTAMMATQKGSEVVRALRARGVNSVEMDILPIAGQGDESRVLVSYDAYSAHAPAGCTTMPGTESALLEPQEDYRLGCTINTMVARQVARPQDLQGVGAPGEHTEGRSAANIVDVVRSGAENKELKGESASGKN